MYIDHTENLSRTYNARHACLQTTRLFGFNLVRSTRPNMADLLVNAARDGQRLHVNFLNAHCVNLAANDDHYRAILQDSDMLLPDGSGLALAARMARQPMGDNLNGTDLFPDLCERASVLGVSIYLIGGQPGIAEAAARTMQAKYPALRIAGYRDGFFSPDQTDAVVDAINASGAGMVFVGMGVPLQEKWIARNSARLHAPVLLGVGGLFDYYSGRIPRAPMAFRAVGCEWVWRLMMEPRRLARRYILGNLLFMARAWFYAASNHGGGWSTSSRKRLLDLFGGIAALMLLLPLMLFVAIAIAIETRGPILFRQIRIGENGRPFVMWKFRSMVVDAHARRSEIAALNERDSICFKIRRDPRVTRVGAFIRRTSIDELPQIINVLRGEMSIVGPRPALPEEVLAYQGQAWKRLHGKPGLTCIWQTSGRAEIRFEEQVEMDLHYLRNSSIAQDLALIGRTIPAVMKAKGAY
ncbi:WecB/TagA/CpsF family glycosyl transferase [Novosphingobium nitrogenifigens DSM 19370]|uniref:WecB/TagA/CpsF family glycosyl transferase n=1 Tax=Novosphingobium nitrogenifigens DSM 19370 TaxID=983920 RepID=F1Z8D8_9SPHN|nr:WecB/TagA/CpsF family glycosyltransferase [Novosphingobium nitrogenifigens]EGD59087.1 WecB/TagA/CpsF family glycosyl transferase [Novosphingobium nitrogenifigens DSM 19370]